MQRGGHRLQPLLRYRRCGSPSRHATALRRASGRLLELRKGPPVGGSCPYHNGPPQPHGDQIVRGRRAARMDHMTHVPRTLVNVQRELSVALQHKTRDLLKIGRLLNEAKAFVEHGEWLQWLRRHTALTKRSAQNYMKAAAWADA